MHPMHIPSTGIVKTVYSSFFKDIEAYSTILTNTQLERRGEVSPALFENRKKSLDFGKKGPDCVHHWVKLSIQNVVLRVSRRKEVQNISRRDLFSLCF